METTEIIDPFDQYRNMSLEELEQTIITLWNENSITSVH